MIKQQYTIEDANSSNLVCIAMDFVDSDLSLRKFAAEYCDFSHVTLRDKLINSLPSLIADLGQEVKNKLETRRGKPIHEDQVAKERVLRAAALLLNENLTINEIAIREGTTEMVIYRDLTRRLQ